MDKLTLIEIVLFFKDKMRDLFSGLVSSAETGLSNFLSLEEKENMAASKFHIRAHVLK